MKTKLLKTYAEYKQVAEEEEKRLGEIRLPISVAVTNFMTDREREYFILGQVVEHQIYTGKRKNKNK